MHAAKASTKRAALFELEAAPVPDTQIFGYTVTIVTYYLKGVRILFHEAVDAGSLQVLENVGGL